MQNQNNVLRWDDCIPVKRWLLLTTIIVFILSVVSYIFVALVRFVYLKLGKQIDAETINIDGMTTLIFSIVIFVIGIILILVVTKVSKSVGNHVLNSIFERRESFIAKHYNLYINDREIIKYAPLSKEKYFAKILLSVIIWIFKFFMYLIYIMAIVNMLNRFLLAVPTSLMSCIIIPYDTIKIGDPYVYLQSHNVIEGIEYVILNIKNLYFSTNPDVPIGFGIGYSGMTPFFLSIIVPFLFPFCIIIMNTILKLISTHHICCKKCTVFRNFDCLEKDVVDDKQDFEVRRKEWVDKKQPIRFDKKSQGSEEEFQTMEERIYRNINEKRHSTYQCSYCGQKIREEEEIIIKDSRLV